MIKRAVVRFLVDLRDFVEAFFNQKAVLERRMRKPRGLRAPVDDWSYQR